jgi:nucleoside-diphosphate-sugar epimerase
MITGGTGFIGCHTALALLDAGHEVSLLVRSVDKMHRLFGPDRIEHYTVGDIVDADEVRRAMADCDAVIHIAALVSTHASDAQQVYDTNVGGTKNVLGTAVELGIGAIIHVSSVTALYNPAARVLDEHSPPGNAASGYGRSKVACEKYVRSLQEAGEPVYITYPATVMGPDDPGLTEAHIGMRTYLANFVPVMASGNQYVDVRDVASVHLRLLEEQPPSGRYLLGGHYIPWVELGGILEELTGRKLLKLRLHGGLMRLAGKVCDRIGPWFNMEVPMTEEAMGYATRWVPMDNGRVERELGFQFRPVRETIEDTIRWLYAAGHITAEQAGKVAQHAIAG